ncbi:hypothetical protein C8A05DRAFT_17812 [Staphylotrichum tortipilum]|uniref:Uncharacterized protein n=1 Tax=Staphylotrichum tortipilum TaxID=2831512 RepID=A0AAN6RRT7_9PEZI|nr:hypothetical protein C8A05DRAFT_17812 [Staphylotrichum longicolle]
MIAHGHMDAYTARNELGLENAARPVFCFERFGRTVTLLPDGRVVFVGGEHEDHYDPDFFIYNDVVVVHGRVEPAQRSDFRMYSDTLEDDANELWKTAWSARGVSPEQIDIYRYPVDVFAPTDFHSATYYKDEGTGKEYIYIIGGLGYPNSIHRDATVTYRLDLGDFSIRRMRTSGQEPPPGDGTERITTLVGDAIEVVDMEDTYTLSLVDLQWSVEDGPVGRGRRVFWRE